MSRQPPHGEDDGRSHNATGRTATRSAGRLEQFSSLCQKHPKSHTMKIAVVGTGYVGLVQGTCLAESGNDVVCVDKVESKIEGLVQGRSSDLRAGLGRAGAPQPA